MVVPSTKTNGAFKDPNKSSYKMVPRTNRKGALKSLDQVDSTHACHVTINEDENCPLLTENLSQWLK